MPVANLNREALAQNTALFSEYQRRPTQANLAKILEANKRLVKKIADRMKSQCDLEQDDLEQLGTVGLLRAIKKFNPSNGATLSSFAVPYIQGEILHYLRDHGTSIKIPRRFREIHASVKKRHRELGQLYYSMGETLPSLRKVALSMIRSGELQISEKLWHDIEDSMAVRIYPLTYADDDDDTDVEVAYVEPEMNRYQPVTEALSKLPPKQRRVVQAKFCEGRDDSQIARLLGITEQRVRELLEKASATLRSELSAHYG